VKSSDIILGPAWLTDGQKMMFDLLRIAVDVVDRNHDDVVKSIVLSSC
jgi:hypothetical protein